MLFIMVMKSLQKVQYFKTIKSTTEMIYLNFTKIYSKIKISTERNLTAEMELLKIKALEKINNRQALSSLWNQKHRAAEINFKFWSTDQKQMFKIKTYFSLLWLQLPILSFSFLLVLVFLLLTMTTITCKQRAQNWSSDPPKGFYNCF